MFSCLQEWLTLNMKLRLVCVLSIETPGNTWLYLSPAWREREYFEQVISQQTQFMEMCNALLHYAFRHWRWHFDWLLIPNRVSAELLTQVEQSLTWISTLSLTRDILQFVLTMLLVGRPPIFQVKSVKCSNIRYKEPYFWNHGLYNAEDFFLLICKHRYSSVHGNNLPRKMLNGSDIIKNIMKLQLIFFTITIYQ